MKAVQISALVCLVIVLAFMTLSQLGCSTDAPTTASDPGKVLECDEDGECREVALRCEPCDAIDACAEGLFCDFGPSRVCKTVGEKGRVCAADCVNDDAMCKQYGRCSLVDGLCVALTREDCVGSDACKLYGKCTPVDNECWVGSDEDCALAYCCTGYGKCTRKPSPSMPAKGVCVQG